MAYDRQAESCAAGLAGAGLVHPVEALEDAVEVAGGDADARVVDAEHSRSVLRREGDPNLSPGGGVSDGVVQEVVHKEAEIGFGARNDQIAERIEDDADAQLVRARAQPVRLAGYHLVQAYGLALQRPALQSGERQQVLNQVREPGGFLLQSS